MAEQIHLRKSKVQRVVQGTLSSSSFVFTDVSTEDRKIDNTRTIFWRTIPRGSCQGCLITPRFVVQLLGLFDKIRFHVRHCHRSHDLKNPRTPALPSPYYASTSYAAFCSHSNIGIGRSEDHWCTDTCKNLFPA